MELKESLEKLQLSHEHTIDAISMIVESRIPTRQSSKARSSAPVAIADKLGLSEERINLIVWQPDPRMGNIYPSEILTKTSLLGDLEFAMIKSHPTVGYDILSKVDFIPIIVDIVYQHHERMDGSGYPLGISVMQYY